MPKYGIDISLAGQQRISRVFETLGDAVKDFSPVWNKIIDKILIPGIKANFETEGGAVGGWEKLKPKYAAWKKKKGFHKEVLQKTGLMRESLEKVGLGKSYNIERIEKQTMTFGTSVDYAYLHQKGKGHLPQRRILVFWPNDARKVVSAMRRHIYKTTGVSSMPGGKK